LAGAASAKIVGAQAGEEVTTATATTTGQDIPTRKLIAALVVVALGLVAYFAVIKPPIRQHTLDVRATRRAACLTVPDATRAAIVAGLDRLGGREMRSLRAMPGAGGWLMVSADFARPSTPRGFTGEITTWRVSTAPPLVIQSVDRFARDYSTFPPAPPDVKVAAPGVFDSRWCAKNAALSPLSSP
jgi:hypothetical protein